ncbi:MAG: hypothetical protein E6I88_02695 [Chloroflexi bacterium]|nr:MAG: hypothetical protein E6I88_02695 [Chloroflexota bacterium]TME44367.1 MAG: hypothetical protein E6I56_12430 [Chloroflexota bacterium]
MTSKNEVEARLRNQAQGFDDQMPRRSDFERRVIARIASQPMARLRRPTILRDLALAGLVMVLIASLGYGVVQLRTIRQATTVKSPHPSTVASLTPTTTAAPTLGPTLSYTPGLHLPTGPIELGSVYTGTPFKMMTPLRGWAVGPPGKDRAQVHDAVLVTADGGAHWRNVTPPGFSGWTDRTMYFLDVTHAWVAVTPHVVAHPAATPATITVFRTADGAQSWQSSAFQLADGSPSQLDFVDPQHGWMMLQVDNGVAVYRTTDGGGQWEQTAVSHYTTPSATASGTLPMSNAFGPNAAKQTACELDPFRGMSFRDAVTGWAAGRCVGPAPSPYFYVTHDGGTTWQAQPLAGLPPTLACPCDVGSTVPVFSSSRDAMMTVSVDTEHTSCQPQNGGTACGTESIPGIAIVYLTHDGGITWAPHVLPGVAAGADPTFIDARTGWYGASVLQAAPSYLGETTFDKLYVTHDGGSSWNATGTGSGFSGGPMQFISSSLGWALGSLANLQPALLTTSDGGRTWTSLNPAVTG